MKYYPLYLTCFILLCFSCKNDNSTVIKGRIIDRPLDTLILFKSHLDPRYHGIKIPIQEDSTFYHKFTPERIEEYQIAFDSEVKKSAYLNIPFYSDSRLITFELQKSEEHEKNKINGSELTKYKKEHQQRIAEEYEPILATAYQKLYTDEIGSEKRIILEKKVDSLHTIMFAKSMEQHKQNPNLVGFNEFVSQLECIEEYSIPLQKFEKYYTYWIEKYPSHPLTERAINKYTALTGLQNEKNYIEFETIDDLNNVVTFSTNINKNKFTLLDLWAPWCGPCIRKSQQVQSDYETLSKNGLSVFSVVGGIKNKDEYDIAVNRLKYPWLSHIEIKDQNKIWEKYGISYAGGSQFLFDNSGKLLATNPSIDELRRIIELLE